ncbi:hypothetical protein LCGC14_2254260 [marine sediment metagenome]|uniref:Uncharacterized protein n=1 Tax=marine sediment metagenome TaxID=412755 RepID=A0A0F9DP38_9ZZZZ
MIYKTFKIALTNEKLCYTLIGGRNMKTTIKEKLRLLDLEEKAERNFLLILTIM